MANGYIQKESSTCWMGSKRSVTISASLSRKLALHKRVQGEQRLKIGNEWRDLNFERNTAQVRRALVRHKKVWRFQQPKTKASARSRVL